MFALTDLYAASDRRAGPRLRLRLAGILAAPLVALLVSGCGGSEVAGTPPSPHASVSSTASPGGAGGSAKASPGASRRPPAPSTLPSSTPLPQVGPPAASQQLAFSGDISGNMTTLSAQNSGAQSECTTRPRDSGAWASTLFGPVDGTVYGFTVTVKPYNGPGTYGATQTTVQVFTLDKKQVWESQPGASLTFSIGNDEQTGSVEATLDNLSSNQPTLTIKGRWSCAP
ncbi:MAG: hypothetical protein WAM30_16625 [Candidatus Dormiibacterota bacterium]